MFYYDLNPVDKYRAVKSSCWHIMSFSAKLWHVLYRSNKERYRTFLLTLNSSLTCAILFQVYSKEFLFASNAIEVIVLVFHHHKLSYIVKVVAKVRANSKSGFYLWSRLIVALVMLTTGCEETGHVVLWTNGPNLVIAWMEKIILAAFSTSYSDLRVFWMFG